MKAVLVIDMPEDCSECELRGFSNETDDPVCCVNGFPCDYSGRPDRCALRLMPEREDDSDFKDAIRIMHEAGMEPEYWDGFTLGKIRGWNACLDAIGGGHDEAKTD